jgi:hypothetical protein
MLYKLSANHGKPQPIPFTTEVPMHRTMEAILHPDGTIELLEPLADTRRRRVLVTLLEETTAPAPPSAPPLSEGERLDAALRAAGLLDDTSDIPADLEPLSDEARAALARSIPNGTPLSTIIHEDREERF